MHLSVLKYYSGQAYSDPECYNLQYQRFANYRRPYNLVTSYTAHCNFNLDTNYNYFLQVVEITLIQFTLISIT